mgnify:FL=1
MDTRKLEKRLKTSKRHFWHKRTNKFIYNRQIMDNKKDTTRDISTGDSNTGKGVEGQDYFSGVSKRTEKLSSALYLITNLVSDTEPLKWELRSRGIDIMSDIFASKIHSLAERAMLLSRTQNTVYEVLSLLEIGRVGALISEMNCAILKREYGVLLNILREGEQMKSPAEEFVSELFKEEEKALPEGSRGNDAHYKGHGDVLYNERKYNVLYKKTAMSFSNKQVDSVSDKSVKDIQRGRNAIVEERQSRKKLIIELIKREKEITIKDAMSVIKGCSEKTVQRELGTLVSDNVLKKEGKKRWCKYSMK